MIGLCDHPRRENFVRFPNQQPPRLERELHRCIIIFISHPGNLTIGWSHQHRHHEKKSATHICQHTHRIEGWELKTAQFGRSNFITNASTRPQPLLQKCCRNVHLVEYNVQLCSSSNARSSTWRSNWWWTGKQWIITSLASDDISWAWMGSFLLVFNKISHWLLVLVHFYWWSRKLSKLVQAVLGDSNLDEISFLAVGNLAFPPQTLFSRSESCQIEVDLLTSGFRASVPGCQWSLSARVAFEWSCKDKLIHSWKSQLEEEEEEGSEEPSLGAQLAFLATSSKP